MVSIQNFQQVIIHSLVKGTLSDKEKVGGSIILIANLSVQCYESVTFKMKQRVLHKKGGLSLVLRVAFGEKVRYNKRRGPNLWGFPQIQGVYE